MEQKLDPSLPPDLQLTPVVKRFPVWLITLLVVISILVAGTGYWFIYSKVLPQTVQSPQPGTTLPVVSSNAKIFWVSNPPRLANISSPKKNNQTTTGNSAMCLPGTQCQDTFGVSEDIPNYYACTLDTQCSFFSGFTGVQTGREVPQTSAPVQQTDGSASAPTQPPGGGAPTTNPALPLAVSGAEGCFNKIELLQNARNVGDLKENNSITCECGIQPPSNSISGSPGAVDANTGEVTPGTMSSVENQTSGAWICMKPQARPDIMTENFVFPQSVNVNSPFSISFDYKNVGAVGCSETYFQADITRTIAGKSEFFDSVGAHIMATLLNPGEKRTFTLGSQFFLPFNLAGDYKLDIAMFCELPKESHIINNLKEINIQAN